MSTGKRSRREYESVPLSSAAFKYEELLIILGDKNNLESQSTKVLYDLKEQLKISHNEFDNGNIRFIDKEKKAVYEYFLIELANDLNEVLHARVTPKRRKANSI